MAGWSTPCVSFSSKNHHKTCGFHEQMCLEIHFSFSPSANQITLADISCLFTFFFIRSPSSVTNIHTFIQTLEPVSLLPSNILKNHQDDGKILLLLWSQSLRASCSLCIRASLYLLILNNGPHALVPVFSHHPKYLVLEFLLQSLWMSSSFLN